MIIFNFLLLYLLILALIAIVILGFKRSEVRHHAQLNKIHDRLQDSIANAVAPRFVELSEGAVDSVDLAIEFWRIENRIEKIQENLSDAQKNGLKNSIHKLKKYLKKCDIEVIDYTGQKYNEGLNLDILSIETDSSLSGPVIKETIEPTVLLKSQVVHKAKIILARS